MNFTVCSARLPSPWRCAHLLGDTQISDMFLLHSSSTTLPEACVRLGTHKFTHAPKFAPAKLICQPPPPPTSLPENDQHFVRIFLRGTCAPPTARLCITWAPSATPTPGPLADVLNSTHTYQPLCYSMQTACSGVGTGPPPPSRVSDRAAVGRCRETAEDNARVHGRWGSSASNMQHHHGTQAQ